MKKINEFISMTDGIFTEFENQNPTLFYSLFNDLEGETLDYDFYIKCYSRYASPILSNAESLATVVRLIINRYSENWKRIYNVMFEEYEAFYPYYRETETTGTEETTANNSGETNVKNSIFAFNSESASDSEETINTSESANTQNIANTEKTVVKGNNGNMAYSDLIHKEIEARKLCFIDIVFNDVMQYITLSIY